MGEVAAALSQLQPEEVARVLRWAAEKYRVGVSLSAPSASTASRGPSGPPSGETSQDSREFTDFPMLFDAASPQSGLERILVGAYWFQVVQGQPDFDAQSLNAELKDMGHRSANITRDMDSLMNRQPRLILQTKKEGKAKQARKLYRLSQEGIKEVHRMFERKNAAPMD